MDRDRGRQWTPTPPGRPLTTPATTSSSGQRGAASRTCSARHSSSDAGQVDLAALETELQRRTEFIAVDGILTTKETLRQEQRMVALVNQGLGGCRPLAPGFRRRLQPQGEQRQALEFVLRSPDEVIGLRGRAGTGKTQTAPGTRRRPGAALRRHGACPHRRGGRGSAVPRGSGTLPRCSGFWPTRTSSRVPLVAPSWWTRPVSSPSATS